MPVLHHYNLEDREGRRTIHVCLVETESETGTIYARGLAFCNKLDYGNLTKARGFAIARGRALKAIKLCRSARRIRRPEVFDKVPQGSILVRKMYKSNYNCTISAREEEMVKKRRIQQAEWELCARADLSGRSARVGCTPNCTG